MRMVVWLREVSVVCWRACFPLAEALRPIGRRWLAREAELGRAQ
jgi:hypothetical protein